MKYSIIVPHFNSCDGLDRLLKSIPFRKDVEVIVIDDNSDVVIFNKLKDIISNCRCEVYLHRNDSGSKGAGAARNVALSKAIGKYLLFCDADDFLVGDAFDLLDSKMDGENFDIYYFKPTSQCLLTKNLSDRHVFYSELIDKYLNHNSQRIRYQFYVPWSKVYLRDYVITNNFKFDHVIASNDVMFSLTSGCTARMFVTSETFYCVTKGKDTLTVNFSSDILKSRLIVALNEAKYLYDNNIDIEINSIFSLINRYGFYIILSKFRLVFTSFFLGHIRLFPKSYNTYLYNPRKLYIRLLGKRIPLKNKE